MLHIGKTQVNLGIPNAKVLYFGETKMGPIIGESSEPTPGGTILHQYDRVDNKATVVNFFVANDNVRYALCVVDAVYRSGYGMTWGKYGYNTVLPDYKSVENAKAAKDTGTFNTTTVLTNYTVTDYPAFNFARSACTVTVDENTYLSCLPTLDELEMIYTDRVTLDTYDPTLKDYTLRSLTEFKCGGSTGLWSSNEQGINYAWKVDAYNNPHTYRKDGSSFGVIPVIEIPVDENGRVM